MVTTHDPYNVHAHANVHIQIQICVTYTTPSEPLSTNFCPAASCHTAGSSRHYPDLGPLGKDLESKELGRAVGTLQSFGHTELQLLA